MKKTFEIPNPFYWLFGKHVHNYNKLVSDTAMDNNTNHLVFQCKCGEIKLEYAHRESEFYKSLKRK